MIDGQQTDGTLTAIDESPLGKQIMSSFRNSKGDLEEVESALGEMSPNEITNHEWFYYKLKKIRIL